MKIIQPYYKILTPISEGGIEELKHIEKIGRVCYKSEDRITEDGESAKKFVQMLINNNHLAMIEHSSLSVLFTVDRGITHELVRHRIASFAQESTRYCCYSREKYGNEITFIEPFFFKYARNDRMQNLLYDEWRESCQFAERRYLHMISIGATPQEARTVLPNSVKADITVTANYREWRNIFKLRCAPDAHPQMRQIMIPLLEELKEQLPIIFDDIEV